MADDTQNGPQTTTSEVPEQLPVGEGQNGTAPAGQVPEAGSAMIPPQTVGPPQMQAQIQSPGQPPQNLPQTDPLDSHPAVQHAGVLHRVAETLAGGPRIETTIDPNTGTVNRKPVPLTSKQILIGAVANVLGGLGQVSSNLSNRMAGRSPQPIQPLPTQQAAAKQAQQSEEDFNRQQQAKVQQAKVLSANMEAMRTAYAVGKEDDEAKDSVIANHKDDLDQWQKSGAVEASNIPSNELMKKGFDKTKYVAIPDGRVPVFNANGKRATDDNGVPLSQLTYSVVDGTTQTPLSQDKYNQFAKYGLMQAKQGFQLPEGASISSASLAMMNHKIDLIQQTQRELDEVHDSVGGEKVDLASQIKKNPQVLSAIEKFHNDAASADPNDQLKAIQRLHPQAAGIMSELFGNESLQKYQDKKAADLAGAKSAAEAKARTEAEAATPEGKQKLINEQLTGQEKQLNIDKLKKTLSGDNWGDTSLTGEAYLNSLPVDQQSLTREIGTGKIAMNRLDYIIAKKPEVMEAVARAYPDFDSSKVQSYPSTYKEFTSTKNGTAGASLNAGATALKHMSELKDLNTLESRVKGTEDYNRYNNKLDTLTGELATFYNLPKTDKSIEAMKSTLGSFFNRDSAIETQAQSMGDKFDSLEQTWKNAAPSKAYEAPMPYVDDKALAARSKLDPEYAKRAQQQPSSQNAPQPDKQKVLSAINLPGGGHPLDIKYGPNGQTIVSDGKQWLDMKTGKPYVAPQQ